MRLVLYQPDIPQNTGAAIRAAACFGASLEVIEPCGFPLKTRELRRVAMDYGALAEPVVHHSWQDFLKTAADMPISLLTTKGSISLWDHVFQSPEIILLGRESAGVPDEVHERADSRLHIPMAEGARSLNVATSGAIAMAEARRQLGWG